LRYLKGTLMKSLKRLRRPESLGDDREKLFVKVLNSPLNPLLNFLVAFNPPFKRSLAWESK